MSIILGESYALPGDRFTVTTELATTTMTVEASTVGYNRPRQIYDDACDVGIAIRSPRTGKVARFYLDHEDDNDGDVAGWWFRPIPEDCRNNQKLRDTRVLIIND